MEAKQTLILIRGLPGSGKTTLARMLAPGANFAADDHFETPEGYRFNPQELGKAHEICRAKTELALMDGAPIVAVHNTFSQNWEMEHYVQLARVYAANLQIVECQGDFGSVHDVPRAAIEAMRKRWEKFSGHQNERC